MLEVFCLVLWKAGRIVEKNIGRNIYGRFSYATRDKK